MRVEAMEGARCQLYRVVVVVGIPCGEDQTC